MTASIQRVRVRVEGAVQGVGFRPFVHRLAGELGLAGWVLNDARGVVLEAEGDPAALEALLARLASEAPPLATVEIARHRGRAGERRRGLRDRRERVAPAGPTR